MNLIGFSTPSSEGTYNYSYVNETRRDKIETLALDLLMKKIDKENPLDDVALSTDITNAVKAAKSFYDEVDSVTAGETESVNETDEIEDDTLNALEKILNIIIKYEKTDDESETSKSLKKIVKIMENYKNK